MKFFWQSFILLGFILILAGCGGQRLPEDNYLRLGNGGEPKDLDPHGVTGIPEVQIINGIFEGLVTYHPTDDRIPYAGVAERWENSEDGRVWRFTLREEARWSNGDPVTADDFVYSWKRALDPALGCEYADWFYMIEGAEEWNTGQLDSFEEVGIRAPSPKIFEVHLKEPTADFLKILLNHSFLPVHPPTIERFNAFSSRTGGWTQPGNLVGNGAFQLVEWEPHSRIIIERNPHYWDAETVSLDGMIFYPIQDENTELRAFESGQLDITNSLPANRRRWYREERPELLRMDPFAGIYFYRLNTLDPALSDIRVRKALSLAIDREAIIKNILQGGEIPAHAYVPQGIGGYAPPEVIESNPELARQLMAEAGFPDGSGFPKLSLLFNTTDNHRRLAEAIQQMWVRELGIDVELRNQEWKVYLDTMSAMNYQVARAGWIGNLYPQSFLRIYTSDSANNETGFADPVFDDLINQIFTTLDRKERFRLVEEAERRLLGAYPVLPIYWYTNVYLIRPHVKNWNPKLVDQRPYKFVRIERE